MPQPDRALAGGRRVADGIDQVGFNRVLRAVKEISTLVFRVMSIDAWNRANVAFRSKPGVYDKTFGLDKAGLA